MGISVVPVFIIIVIMIKKEFFPSSFNYLVPQTAFVIESMDQSYLSFVTDRISSRFKSNTVASPNSQANSDLMFNILKLIQHLTAIDTCTYQLWINITM